MIMDENMPSSTQTTNGNGTISRIIRRILHLSMWAIPLLYYYYLVPLFPKKSLQLAILGFIFFIIIFERIRIRYRFIFYIQRDYEALQISAFGWTMLALSILFLYSPSAAYTIAIVATCAFVDPLLGELRSRNIQKKWIITAGIVTGMMVWAVCAWLFHLSPWLILLMPPIAVAAELPQWKWVDDNALMMLVPLVVVLLLSFA